MRKIVFLVVLIAIALAGGPCAIAAERLSVPGETRQNEASLLLYEVYGAKLDSKDAMIVKGLVVDLLKQAQDPSNDGAMRYVILKTAAEKAADVGDVATTLATTAQIVAQFKTKTGEIELRAIGNAAKAAKTAGEHGAVARDYINLVFQAIKADDYATAKEAAKLAGYASRKAKDKEVYDKTKDLGKIVRETETLFFAARTAFKTLRDKPDDPNANLAFGRYMCFVKGDWDTGLTHLEKGSDKTLAALAAKDFGDLDDSQEFLSLADAWWALGEKHGAPEQEELFGRARKYYAKALPHLSGLNKIKAEKRLEGLKANDGQKVISFFDIDYNDNGNVVLSKTGDQVVITSRRCWTGLESKRKFKTPITLHMIAKTDSNNIRLHYAGGGVVLAADANNRAGLALSPFNNTSVQTITHEFPYRLDKDKFIDIKLVVAKQNYRIFLDDKLYYESAYNPLSEEVEGPVRVCGAGGSVITIKKLDIILPNGLQLEGGKTKDGEKVISFFDSYEDIGGALQGRSPFVIKSFARSTIGTTAKLASRNEFKPPLTLHLVAKTDSNNLRLGFSGGVAVLGHESDPSLLYVIDPAPKSAPVADSSRGWFEGSRRDGWFYKGGNLHRVPDKGAIDRNTFVDIKWVIGKDGHKLLVNDAVRYVGTMEYDDEIIGKAWVSGAFGSTITIEKFEIIVPRDFEPMPDTTIDATSTGVIIEACVDGDAELVVEKNAIFWQHYKRYGGPKGSGAGKPGVRHGKFVEPTYVNGKPWYPIWGRPQEIRGEDLAKPFPIKVGDPAKLQYKVLSIGLGASSQGIDSRDPIVSTYKNGQFRIYMSDNQSGERWYKLKIYSE